MCERGILPVSPSSNSTVMRSPSSSRPSKPIGGGRGQGKPTAWAPWQTRGRGSRHQPVSSPGPRTHEGRWTVEQDLGFEAGRPRTVGSPGPARHVHPSKALPRVTNNEHGTTQQRERATGRRLQERGPLGRQHPSGRAGPLQARPAVPQGRKPAFKGEPWGPLS